MRVPRLLGLLLAMVLGLTLFTLVVTATNGPEEQGPSQITLTITAGVTPGSCAASESLVVVPGTVVTYCYTVSNVGTLTLPLHALSDSQFGLLFENVPVMLGPGDSVDSVTLGYAPTATISADTTTSATWTAYQSGPSNVNTAMDSIDITVVPPLELQKTVGLSPGICATKSTVIVTPGTDVYYCYTVTNNSFMTRTVHDLDDSELGTLLSGYSFALGPGATIYTVTGSTTIVTDTVNSATWTAYNAGPTDVISATALATVEIGMPSIVLTKTVGDEADVCAGTDNFELPPYGGTVYYCYTVENTGNVTLPLHTLDDSELGNLFTDLAYDLGPGASVDTVSAGLEFSATLTNMTVNTATWTVSSTFGSADATAVATVTIAPIMPAIELTKTVGTDADTCATTNAIEVGPDTPVYYCFTVENTGNYTLTLHDLDDSAFGALLTAFPLPLGPGQRINSADIGGLTFSQTLSATTVNTATWTAYNPGPVHTATATDSATVTVTYHAYLPAVFRK